MNSAFNHISGQIIIKGRAYSAKDIIRGLLEQGIAITESPEGLKIGLKLFTPERVNNTVDTGNATLSGCPFSSFMSTISNRLDDLSRMIEKENIKGKVNDSYSFNSPFSEEMKENTFNKFSPFGNNTFKPSSDQDKENFFSSSRSFLGRQKCPACGAPIPQNAIFCNKCGSHIRSG
ncbi:MAG: zinc ribbon domain-containing protein [Candidatus Hodarchaeales archaeon]